MWAIVRRIAAVVWSWVPHKAHWWKLSRIEHLFAKNPANGRIYDSTLVVVHCSCGCTRHIVFYGKRYEWKEARRHIGG